MQKNAVIRILVPNLRKLQSTLKRQKFFKSYRWGYSIRTDLGYRMLMNFIVSPGQDTILIDRNLKKFIAGYAFVCIWFWYDEGFTKKCGFKSITKKILW